MGGSQSTPQPGAPPMPRGQAQAGFVPGGQAGFVPTGPPGIAATAAANGPAVAFRGNNVFALREVPSEELKSAIWSRLEHEIPVYVAVEGMGTSLTGRVRLVAGVYYYAVHKVYPLNPENNVVVQKYYEVPHVRGSQQLVYQMKYAITQLWPSENKVLFVTDDGGKFPVRYNELLRIKDHHVGVAIAALKKDYPNELDSILSFRTVETPQFDVYEAEAHNTPSSKMYTTLMDTNRSKQIYNALNADMSCPIPTRRKHDPILAPTVVTIPTPSCGLSGGVPSLFEDAPVQHGQVAVAASKETENIAALVAGISANIGADLQTSTGYTPELFGNDTSNAFAALLDGARRAQGIYAR